MISRFARSRGPVAPDFDERRHALHAVQAAEAYDEGRPVVPRAALEQRAQVSDGSAVAAFASCGRSTARSTTSRSTPSATIVCRSGWE